MILFLGLLGFLALSSLLALERANRITRHGIEDGASFDYYEEAFGSMASLNAHLPTEHSPQSEPALPSRAA
jgi:hypothetical protein